MSENNKGSVEPDRHLLVFGLGFAAGAICKQVHKRFDRITVTNRSVIDAANDAYRHLVFDGTNLSDELAQAITTASHILVSIGPNDKSDNGGGDPVINACEQVLNTAEKLEWIGYLSTVGVYGNHDGKWVDEDTICRPVSTRSKLRLAAEGSWRDIAKNSSVPLTIFRLSGIYGPARNALVNIEKGRSRRLVKKGQVFNRIHRDDIANAVERAIEIKADGIFNITDDEPAPPQDVVAYVHHLRGIEPPPEIDFETADITPMARSFYGENKRVSNARSKSVLGMQYAWPDYRKAFDAMWKNDTWR
jgi:nucleoside-diphosphate-sugar epimerase